MATRAITGGVWPTMITPFTPDGAIDYPALGEMIEWYIARGVHGLFAVCQSSEMFRLDLDERVKLAGFVKEAARGRVPVIASGHIGETFEAQAEEMREIAATGIDAFVMITNRLAIGEASEEAWKRDAERLLEAVPDIDLGMYECPYPQKRLLSPSLLRWCADTGRFAFLKDTSCDLDLIYAKNRAVEGTRLKIFNANTATLLSSLKLGAAGFSGVMANFHPELYVQLVERWQEDDAAAQLLQNFLSVAAFIERQCYPVNAKYHMQLEGMRIGLHTRVRDAAELNETLKLEVRQLRDLAGSFAKLA